MSSESPSKARRALEQADRQVTAAEAAAYLAAPISEVEREEAVALIRWFRRRYPTGADRLRYTYLAVLERPELYELLDHFDETQIRAAVERAGDDVEAILANLEKNHAGSEPSALWTSWVETVHPDKLGEKPSP